MCTYIINLIPSLPIFYISYHCQGSILSCSSVNFDTGTVLGSVSCSVYFHTIVRVLFRILSLGRGSYIKFPKKKKWDIQVVIDLMQAETPLHCSWAFPPSTFWLLTVRGYTLRGKLVSALRQARLHEAKGLVHVVLLVTYPDKGTFQSFAI